MALNSIDELKTSNQAVSAQLAAAESEVAWLRSVVDANVTATATATDDQAEVTGSQWCPGVVATAFCYTELVCAHTHHTDISHHVVNPYQADVQKEHGSESDKSRDDIVISSDDDKVITVEMLKNFEAKIEVML